MSEILKYIVETTNKVDPGAKNKSKVLERQHGGSKCTLLLQRTKWLPTLTLTAHKPPELQLQEIQCLWPLWARNSHAHTHKHIHIHIHKLVKNKFVLKG